FNLIELHKVEFGRILAQDFFVCSRRLAGDVLEDQNLHCLSSDHTRCNIRVRRFREQCQCGLAEGPHARSTCGFARQVHSELPSRPHGMLCVSTTSLLAASTRLTRSTAPWP